MRLSLSKRIGLSTLLRYSAARVEEARDPAKARELYARFLETTPEQYAAEERRQAENRLRVLDGEL